MNFINRILLRFALLPKKLYSSNGINISHLQSILTAKLIMDDRRPAPMMSTRKQRQKKEVSKATLTTMLISAITGCVFLFCFSLEAVPIAQFTFYFSYFIFMLASTLISDFTSVLIDVRDNYIIAPKPVNDRTVLMARLLHIFVHICKLVVPMLLPGIIYVGIRFGIAGALLLFITGLLTVIFCIFLVNAFYIVILRFTKPEKFKSIISYIQILFAIVLYASFQLLPRLVGQMENFNLHFTKSSWLIVLPSYWFAATWNVLHTLQGSPLEYSAAICGVTLPFLSLWAVIKFLAPSFNRKLSLISNSGESIAASPMRGALENKQQKIKLIERVATMTTKPGSERMGFIFTWYMMARNRDFKMKVYPAIGYILVYIFIIFFNEKKLNIVDIEQQTGTGKMMIITALYFTSFLTLMAVAQLVYSDKYKAAWIYFITPLKTPGNIINGSIKAAIVKFCLPFIFVLGIAGVALMGVDFIPNLLLAASNQVVICYCMVYFGTKDLPFAKKQDIDAKTGNLLRNMFKMILPFLLAIIHYFIYSNIPLIFLSFIVSCIVLWLLTDTVKKISWAEVQTSFTED
ncbi:MAG: hypothetical protein JST21_17030 [Bacteroidetes bacterium]|nr:hypothetical protein [Bacteroidota bacterium]